MTVTTIGLIDLTGVLEMKLTLKVSGDGLVGGGAAAMGSDEEW
jgi:hypothetical protein